MGELVKKAVFLFVVAAVFAGVGREALAEVELPKSKLQYCRTVTNEQGRRRLIDRLLDYEVDLASGAGILGAGVCWWKSRITRAALYLTYYSPEKRAPDSEEARKILSSLARRDAVVEIPGFRSFTEFTKAFPDLVREALESWQWRDAVRGAMRTLNPLRPTFYRKNENLFRDLGTMQRMLDRYGALPYVIVQMKGVDAHSWLIQKVETVETKSFFGRKFPTVYKMTMLDPNFSRPLTAIVREGDQVVSDWRLEGSGYDPEWDKTLSDVYVRELGNNPIYIDFQIDFDRVDAAIEATCKGYPKPEIYPAYENWGTYR